MRRLEGGGFDIACLDHDLAPAHYEKDYVRGGMEHSGRFVAQWIRDHGTPQIILIHSWNPVGAKAIYDILHDMPYLKTLDHLPFSKQTLYTFLSQFAS